MLIDYFFAAGQENPSTLFLLVALLLLGAAFTTKSSAAKREAQGIGKPIPFIPSSLPFLGSVISFGKEPIKFLQNAYEKYGEIFTFQMFGSNCTYLMGPDAVQGFFSSKNEDLNAEDVYANLTVPVFGKGVGYDVPHKIFSEQKRVAKTGLVQTRLETYAEKIEEETRQYFAKWGEAGEADILHALSELIIATAARCLLGKEIRDRLEYDVAHVYKDLDGGFTPAAWLLPAWLPLPSFRKRDRAHAKMKEIFTEVIRNRRANKTYDEEDMLQTLMTTSYKNGEMLTDDQIAGMLIALLLAGQHTSSTTSAWLGIFLALNKQIQQEAYEEQVELMQSEGADVSFEATQNSLPVLDRVLKETLRLRPPIMTMMRMVRTPFEWNGHVVPAGHQICVSPTVNQRIAAAWDNPDTFDPDRFLSGDDSRVGNFSYVPFGAGRHRCIGEHFAYVQIKTIWSVMLREFEFDMAKMPDIDFTTMIHVPKNPIVKYKRRAPMAAAATTAH